MEGVERGGVYCYEVTLHDLHSVVDVTGDGGVLVKRLNQGSQVPCQQREGGGGGRRGWLSQGSQAGSRGKGGGG